MGVGLSEFVLVTLEFVFRILGGFRPDKKVGLVGMVWYQNIRGVGLVWAGLGLT